METIAATPGLRAAFVLLALLVAAGFLAGVYRAGLARGRDRADARRSALRWSTGVVVWMALTAVAAASGRLSFETMPPTMMVLFVVIVALGFGIGLSKTGERLALGLPLAWLVLFQSFRLPLELIMHVAYRQGLMPEQMSYSGLNFDIVTGLLALLVGGLVAARRVSLRIVWAWNVLGSVLLANILAIALLSAPTPLRAFHNEPANVWVTHAPWVWLPAVFVLAAILGHIVIFRRLRHEAARADDDGRKEDAFGPANT